MATIKGTPADDTLTGTAGNDVIDGLGGKDTLEGDLGADTLHGGDGNDSIWGDILGYLYDGDNDVLYGEAGNDLLVGGPGNDVIYGGAGDDRMDESNYYYTGSEGADTLSGGSGNDIYTVDERGDIVVELAGEGTDTVVSALSFTLGPNVENLMITGLVDAWEEGRDEAYGTGNDLANTITANSPVQGLRFVLSGLGGNDTLLGGDGNDTLNGGTGADSMTGGAGNDLYYVDSNSDKVIELSGQGTDSVSTSVSYTLAANVENLTLTGTSGLSGTGNGLANVLTGNGGANKLSGLDGNDTLNGLGGNDTLLGGNGNDTLNGGTGADSMTGAAGNDLYYVDNGSDTVIEALSGGTDSVSSSVSYTLATNVENLTLTGTSGLSGTGNGLANVLTTGNSGANKLSGLDGNDTLNGLGGNDTPLGGNGNDTLNGGTGADSMTGGTGNDTYYVDNGGDTVTAEAASGGTDSVSSSVSYTLAANVENLTVLYASAVNGTGNTLANVLTGNSGNNILSGLAGNDTLGGGAGNDRLIGGDGADRLTGSTGDDRFEFAGASTSPYGAGDRITDFNTGNDTIVIDLASGSGAFIGTSSFKAGGAIEARYDSVGDQVQVDLNNNGVFGAGDLQILGLAVAPTTSDFAFV